MPIRHLPGCRIVHERGDRVKDLLLLIVFLVVWIVLQRYVLPRFGVST